MPIRPLRKKHVVFLCNPGAKRSTTDRVAAVAAAWLPSKTYRLEFVRPNDWQEIYPLALRAARNKAYAVVAVGGDGTINQVSQALAGTRCRLGVVPAGTGNGFARALGLPLDPVEACRILSQGVQRRVDHVEVDRGRGFVNMLGVGWDAWIAQTANRLRWMNRYSGFLRYLSAAVLCLPKARPQDLAISMGRQTLRGRYLLVAVGNSPQYGFGCTIAPEAELDDGLLDVVLVPTSSPWTLVRNCVRLFTRQPLLGASFHRARSLSIRSPNGDALAIHLDGEAGGTTPARLKVHPRALRVLVPRKTQRRRTSRNRRLLRGI
jgi:diacylglycerol kinase (ATP)